MIVINGLRHLANLCNKLFGDNINVYSCMSSNGTVNKTKLKTIPLLFFFFFFSTTIPLLLVVSCCGLLLVISLHSFFLFVAI